MIKRLRTYLAQDGLGPVLIKAVTGSAGLRIFGMGFGFLVGVQLARGLGAEGYGVYGLAMSIIALLSVPTQFGLPQLLTREVASAHAHQQWGKIHGIIRWSTRMSMATAVLVALALLAWLNWKGALLSPLGDTLLAGMAMVPLAALLSLHAAALRGTQQIVRGQLPEIAIRPALHSLLLFIVPQLLFPVTAAVAMWLGVFAAAASLVHAHWLLHRALPPQVPGALSEMMPRHWWSSALPMAMTEGMRLLQSHVLIFFLSAMVAMAEVGVFRMAASTAVLVATPLSLFNIVSMPVVAKLHATGQIIQLRRMLALVSLGMVGGVLLLSLPFFLAGKWLIGAVFGSQFAAGHAVLLVLCIAGLVNAMFGINAALLNMTGHEDRVTLASALALGVLLMASPVLIQRHGIVGAGYANLFSVATWNVLMWRDCLRMLGLDTGVWGSLRR